MSATTLPGTGKLPALAAAIVREHDLAHKAANVAMAHALRCGELLKEAQAKLPHGKWERWLKQNTKIAPRTARAYMQIAALDPANRQRVAELPLREALKAVAQHKYLPDDERGEVLREESRQKHNAWCRKHSHPELPPIGPAVIVEGEPRFPALPNVPPTAEEIADGIVAQLDDVLAESGGDLTIPDLQAAFSRRFGATQVQFDTAGAELVEPTDKQDIAHDNNDPRAFLLRVDQSVQNANFAGPVSKKVIDAAAKVVAAWCTLLEELVSAAKLKTSSPTSGEVEAGDNLPKRKKRKTETHKTTIGAAIVEAFAEIQGLAEEVRWIVDNASDGFRETERIQTLETTADMLENLEEPVVADSLAVLPVSYTLSLPNRKDRALSRCARMANAITVLDACTITIDNSTFGVAAESDSMRKAATELVDVLTAMGEEAQSCEFPGMFG